MSQEFHHAEELIKHVYVHSFTDNGSGSIGGTIYNCYQCDRRYRNSIHLKVHKMVFFRLNILVISRTFNYKYFILSYTIYFVIAQAHQAKHKENEMKPYKCDMCDKRFMNTVVLTCHVRTHFG